eukprot:g5614.t1
MTSTSAIDVNVGNGDSLKVVILTWNVGNAQPKLAEIPTLLGTKEELANVDLIVCGSQEAVYTPVPDEELTDVTEEPALQNESLGDTKEQDEKLKAYKAKNKKEVGLGTKVSNLFENKALIHYQNMYESHINTCGFSTVKCADLGEMRLFVFAKKTILKDITKVEEASSCTGLGHIMANKGGLLISFLYKTYSLAFISAHLAAHLQHFKKRNEDIWEILQEARTADKDLDAFIQHDYVFWMGDLNYRVDLNTARGKPMPPKKGEEHKKHWDEVKALVDKKNYQALLNADQLIREQRKGEIFYGFVEAPITYQPTFKVQRQKGTDYKEQRAPSYCDRILWRSQPWAGNDTVVPEKVEPLESVSTSDHKPVRGIYRINFVPKLSYSNVTENSKVAHLILKKVRGVKLTASDISGASDPYLKFRLFPENTLVMPKNQLTKLSSSYKSANLNPSYAKKDLPTLVTKCQTVDELSNVVLYMGFWDYDSLDADDELGGVCLHLKPYLKNVKSGKKSIINIKDVGISLYGKKLESRLSCEIEIDWQKMTQSKQPEKGYANQGCCSIV